VPICLSFLHNRVILQHEGLLLEREGVVEEEQWSVLELLWNGVTGKILKQEARDVGEYDGDVVGWRFREDFG
jgi:hypothetical protein